MSPKLDLGAGTVAAEERSARPIDHELGFGSIAPLFAGTDREQEEQWRENDEDGDAASEQCAREKTTHGTLHGGSAVPAPSRGGSSLSRVEHGA